MMEKGRFVWVQDRYASANPTWKQRVGLFLEMKDEGTAYVLVAHDCGGTSVWEKTIDCIESADPMSLKKKKEMRAALALMEEFYLFQLREHRCEIENLRDAVSHMKGNIETLQADVDTLR